MTDSFSFGSNLLQNNKNNNKNNNKSKKNNSNSSTVNNNNNNNNSHNNHNDNSNSNSNSGNSNNNNDEKSSLESCTAVNEDETVQQLIAKDKPVVDWMLRKVNSEKAKLQKQGAKVKILRVKNTSLIRQTEEEEEEEGDEEESQNNKEKSTTVTAEKSPNTQKEEKILNRVELDCLLDFENVVQLLVSEPELCDVKQKQKSTTTSGGGGGDFYYVNVILLMSKGTFAYLFPYLYSKSEKSNALQHWALINNQFKRTDISIDAFEQVQQDHE